MSDQKYQEQGKTVQFGFGQLSNPTPNTLKVVFRTILYLSAIWALLSPQFTELPENTLHSIDKWLLIGNGLINVTIKFFGYDFRN